MLKGKLAVVFVVMYFVLGLTSILLVVRRVSIDSDNEWNWGWAIISVMLLYLVLSFKTVGPTEKAALIFFGRPLYEVEKGLAFVPWAICQLWKISGLTIQMQIPGEPEEIDKSGEDSRGLLAGKKVLPIRLTTSSYEIAKADPRFQNEPALVSEGDLSQRMTLEVTAVVIFRVKDVIKFIQTIETIEAARKRLRDTMETAIAGEFAIRTPALIIAHRAQIDGIILKRVTELVGNIRGTAQDESWGIDIYKAQLVDIDISKKVNQALSQATEAVALGKQTVITATASRKATILAGQGAANAEKALLLARAKGQTALAALAQTESGRYVQALQTVGEMSAKAKYSIVGADGLAGTVASALETIKRIRDSSPPNTDGEQP